MATPQEERQEGGTHFQQKTSQSGGPTYVWPDWPLKDYGAGGAHRGSCCFKCIRPFIRLCVGIWRVLQSV